MPRQPFFTVAEVMEILRIKDRSTIYRKMRAGEIEYVKVGRLTRFPRENLIAYLEKLNG